MSTITQTEFYPLLVSELPAAPVRTPSRLKQRQSEKRFERALRVSTGQESVDLMAQLRAQRTVTRTFS